MQSRVCLDLIVKVLVLLLLNCPNPTAFLVIM